MRQTRLLLACLCVVASGASVSIGGGTPTLIARTERAGQYVYFPQTMRWVGNASRSLLVSYQSDSDALHDDGWTGGLLGSGDGGATWESVAQPLSPLLVKSCFPLPGGHSIKCFQYPLTKISPGSANATAATLGAHVYTATTDAPGGATTSGASGAGAPPPFAQTSVMNATLSFPPGKELKSWGAHTFLMVSDGKVLALPPGKAGAAAGRRLLMLLYGSFAAGGGGANPADAHYSIVAMRSADGGASWAYAATVAHGATAGCADEPSEHDCTFLADGSIYCVWRNSGTLCSSRSADEGATWQPAQPLVSAGDATAEAGAVAAAVLVPQQPVPITPACQTELDRHCSNASATAATASCISSTTAALPDALPMFGLYDLGCAESAATGCIGPGTARPAWRCYSHLATAAADSHRWSNASAHPNAYCSGVGPELAALYAQCMHISPAPTPAPPIPAAPSGVEPKIERLPNGLLVVSSGRPGLYVWAAKDPTSAGAAGASVPPTVALPLAWHGFNLADHHNSAYNDSSLHFSSSTPGADETTSYTGMVAVPGENAVLVSYDRLANGWDPAPWPPSPLTRGASALFTVKLTISAAR